MQLSFFMTLELRYILVERYNYVSFLFVIVTYFLLRCIYVICLFDKVTFFNDVRITFYFGTFKLRMEITLRLPFVFVRQLRYVLVTFLDYVRITLYFGTFELRTEMAL